jgi:hypothetical protein
MTDLSRKWTLAVQTKDETWFLSFSRKADAEGFASFLMRHPDIKGCGLIREISNYGDYSDPLKRQWGNFEMKGL